jgi:hypothetical protein
LALSWSKRFDPHQHQGGGVTERYDAAQQRASTRSLLARDGTWA